jgi:hypothetical protein
MAVRERRRRFDECAARGRPFVFFVWFVVDSSPGLSRRAVTPEEENTFPPPQKIAISLG